MNYYIWSRIIHHMHMNVVMFMSRLCVCAWVFCLDFHISVLSKFCKQYTILTTWMKLVWNISKFIIQNNISIHSLCSILCWSTSGNYYSLKYFWVWCYKLGTSIFGRLLPFSFARPLKRHQVGWGTSVRRFSDLSRVVQSRSSLGSGCATLGHSQSCPAATPLLSWLWA